MKRTHGICMKKSILRKNQKPLNSFRLYFRYIRLQFLSGIQYKGWWMMIPQVFLVVITDPIGSICMFARFGSIGEWSMERILLIYSIAITAFGLAETFCRGFDSFPHKMVQNGEFDRVLLRPRSTVVQVMGSVFHIHRAARVLSGCIAIAWCLWQLQIPMTPLKILFLLYSLCGGMLLYMGVFIWTSGISFFSIKGLEWIYIFTNGGYQVTRCPIPYMPRLLKNIFTFLIPILAVSYYPASVLCGWGEPLWKGLLSLPAGIGFLSTSLLMWRFGVRHYRSTGS